MLFTARTSDNTVNVSCTGCGTAAPTGRFYSYFSYYQPDNSGTVNMYWDLTNNTSGTLGYGYDGATDFAGSLAPVATSAAMASASPLSRGGPMPARFTSLANRIAMPIVAIGRHP